MGTGVQRKLRHIREQQAELERAKFDAMTEARAQGFSCKQIGMALGVTKQAARRWYLRHKNPEDGTFRPSWK